MNMAMIGVGLLPATRNVHVAKCSIISRPDIGVALLLGTIIAFKCCHPVLGMLQSTSLKSSSHPFGVQSKALSPSSSSSSSSLSSAKNLSFTPFPTPKSSSLPWWASSFKSRPTRPLSATDHELRRSPNITDLIVQVGQNVLLECSGTGDRSTLAPDNDAAGRLDRHYLWCRLEDRDWIHAHGFSRRAVIEIGDELDSINDAFISRAGSRPASSFTSYRHPHHHQQQQHQQQHARLSRPCFEGGRHFIASENRIATVLYRCTVQNEHGNTIAIHHWKLYVDQLTNMAVKRDTASSTTASSTATSTTTTTTTTTTSRPITAPKVFDFWTRPSTIQSPIPGKIRPTIVPATETETTTATATTTTESSLTIVNESSTHNASFMRITKSSAPINEQPSFAYTTIVPRCDVPRCKAYASVLKSECSTIVLRVRYPESQYGYNRSTSEWTTIHCDTNIDGFQIWIIGQGVVRKYPRKEHPNNITISGLVPGRRYCFNGWSYNGCGAGPVFTLEGVCVRNLPHCTQGAGGTVSTKTTTVSSPGTSIDFEDYTEQSNSNNRQQQTETSYGEHCELDFDYGLN